MHFRSCFFARQGRGILLAHACTLGRTEDSRTYISRIYVRLLHRHKDIETHRHADTETHKHRETERQRDTETQRDAETQRETDTQRDTGRHGDTERHRYT